MSKIKVGEYVRTKNGHIAKIEKLCGKDAFYKNIEYYRVDTYIKNDFIIYKEDIAKCSKNIIDLIEVGDYVNGYKVIEKTKTKDGKMQICIYKDNTCSCWRTINNITLKSIVTKEQFEESEYKVNE